MNTFGKNFRLTTFGESHGIALGAVIDGCPAGLELSAADIQRELDRRKPGQSKVSTQRKEEDKAEILSGVFEGKTLGTPIAVIVRNEDQRSKDYGNIKDVYRPGHADKAWDDKYGHRDYRGGGRSSGRETLSRVIGGAIAKKILSKKGIELFGHVVQVGKLRSENFDKSEIEKNPVRCADPKIAKQMEELIIKTKQEGDSVGSIIRVHITGCPKGVGEPVFDKLQANLAKAFFSVGTVRSVELLPGKAVSSMKGSEVNKIDFGISGGISTGGEIVFEIGLKPTPSIGIPQDMHSKSGKIIKDQIIVGRHDPCIAPRAVPVFEAMAALVVADFFTFAGKNIV